MDQPLISVIIPVYNMEIYLERCLDSVLNNTYRNLEIICIDDGSTDRSLDILRRYETADPRIVVVAKENGGVSSARNAGLDRMSGEYVTFIDPDDYVHPQYVELLVTAQQLSNAEIIIGEYQTAKGIEPASDFTSYNLTIQDMDQVSVFIACQYDRGNTGIHNRLISRNIIGNTRFHEDFSYGEDTFYMLELYSEHQTIHVGLIPQKIYYYCLDRSDSLVHTRRDHDILRYFSALSSYSSIKGNERIYLDVLIRRGLYYRYYYMYVQIEPRIARELDKLLRHELIPLLKLKSFSLKFKVSRIIFILFPAFERQYRFYREPSLKKYEKLQKKALAEGRSVT